MIVHVTVLLVAGLVFGVLMGGSGLPLDGLVRLSSQQIDEACQVFGLQPIMCEPGVYAPDPDAPQSLAGTLPP